MFYLPTPRPFFGVGFFFDYQLKIKKRFQLKNQARPLSKPNQPDKTSFEPLHKSGSPERESRSILQRVVFS
jgi:hypothetical protein